MTSEFIFYREDDGTINDGMKVYVTNGGIRFVVGHDAHTLTHSEVIELIRVLDNEVVL